MRKLVHFNIIVFIFVMAFGLNTNAQSTVNFIYSESLVFVKAKLNNSKAFYTFLVNTGANTTVIDKKIAGALKLPVQREKDEVLGTAGTEEIELRKANSIAVGNAMIKNMQITVRDLSNLLSGQKVDGILGTDFLEHFCYTIDFRTRQITFTKKQMQPGKLRYIPFEMIDGIPRVTAKIDNNYETYLNYNSGVSMPYSMNSYVNISSKQWEELSKLNPYMNNGTHMSGKGIGGNLDLKSVKVNTVKLSEIHVQKPYLVVQAKEGYFKKDDAVGFFGNSALEKFPKVTIDFIGQNIIVYDYKSRQKSKQ